MKDTIKGNIIHRRTFVKRTLRFLAAGSLGVLGLALGLKRGRSTGEEMVWQLNPDLCIQCEKCSTHCVLPQSAVRCTHSYSMCGYCDLCSGYLLPEAQSRNTGAENMLCPTGAIKRKYVEDPYFEYTVDKDLCIGCGKCVKGCAAFGNGSLYLQVQQDICVHCNECSISRVCPANAYLRVPASTPYILRGDEKQLWKE